MEKINGIIIAGKVYEMEFERNIGSCEECDLHEMYCCLEDYCRNHYCIFRYSQELTDMLNGKKSKRMCLRDKSKVCNLCHECDIDSDEWASRYIR